MNQRVHDLLKKITYIEADIEIQKQILFSLPSNDKQGNGACRKNNCSEERRNKHITAGDTGNFSGRSMRKSWLLKMR